jgi:hypothetical protein
MALPELEMEVGNSRAIASRADLPNDIAALYLLILLDVGRAQMAIASPPRGLIDRVLHHYAVSTHPVREDSYDCPVCRSDHGIAHGGVAVDTLMRGTADPSPYASPIAVVRQNPRVPSAAHPARATVSNSSAAATRTSRHPSDTTISVLERAESPAQSPRRATRTLAAAHGCAELRF